jgi:hypothetical protein
MFSKINKEEQSEWYPKHALHHLYIVPTAGRTLHSGKGTEKYHELDIHESVLLNINLTERTNKMRPCTIIYYSNVS